MFRNYIVLAFRNLWKNKFTTFINISCLAIGVATSILILLYVYHEISYDSLHSRADRIYRVKVTGNFSGSEFDQAITAQPMAQALLNDFPEIEQVVRMRKYGDWLVSYGEKKFHEENYLFADSSFFEVFDFKLIQGNPHTVLKAPRSVVLSESTARKYFGDEPAVGKMIRLETDTTLTMVTGVMEDVPGNSHIHFDMVGSLHTYLRFNRNSWVSHNFYTYVVVKPGTSQKALEEKMKGMIEKYVGPAIQDALGVSLEDMAKQGTYFGYHLQALRSIHLNSRLEYEYEPNGNKLLVMVFFLVSILILLVACINFMNLSTARSSLRAKEIGIRKLLGAQKPKLVLQFLSEAMWMSLLAFAVAIILVLLLLPVFRNMIQVNISSDFLFSWKMIFPALIFILFTGLFAGSYPAFFLASYKPAMVMKGNLSRGGKNIRLRSILVVLQLVAFIFILAGTFVTYRQFQFMVNKDPGFEKENVLVIRRSDVLRDKIESFKQEIRKNPGVLQVTHSNKIPGRNFSNNVVMVENRGNAETFLAWQAWVSDEFAETFDLEMKEGRFFSREIPSDSFAVVINETAVRTLGLKEPVIGQRLMEPEDNQNYTYYPIIGVLKDFHFQSLHTPVQAMRFNRIPGNWEGYIPVRLAQDNIPQTVEFIKNTWESFNQDYPFDYFWMEDDYNKLYQTERRISNVFLSFALITMIIACLGLLGLISYTAVKRTREIGIRKAMGSSPGGIIALFFKETGRLVGIATLFAAPVYYAIHAWLQNFAYHIPFQLTNFAVLLFCSFLLALVLSLGAVSGIIWNASKKNPAEALRYE